ncbi:Rossmann-fold NAD(P)-binding domain-containing protein [Arthrobacter pigmenti]
MAPAQRWSASSFVGDGQHGRSIAVAAYLPLNALRWRPRPVSNKGLLRAWLAERIMASHHRGDVPTVIARAPELYGPRVESLLGRNLFASAVGRSPALWPGDMDQPLGPLFIDDFAYGLAELGSQEAAYGAVWHIPTPPPITARQFVAMINAKAERQIKLHQVSTGAARALGLV